MHQFFGDSGDIAIQQQQYAQGHFQSQDNAPGDQFQFTEPTAVTYEQMSVPQSSTTNAYSFSYNEIDSEALRKTQQEQIRIQEMLRQKSNEEYQAKQRRKQQGRAQYEQFVAKKQRQTMARRAENVQKQQKLLENNAKLSQEAGWKKVAANVALKQGEHKGKKQTTRMRQAIINKKNDESN